MNKEEPKSVTIGVDLMETTIDLSGSGKSAPKEEEHCTICGATKGFIPAFWQEREEFWIFCTNCGQPIKPKA
jgi:hypothetical protein